MRTAISLVVASLLAACGGGEASSETRNVPFTTVAQSGNSGVTAGEGVVARNQAEFNTVWARFSSNLLPPPQAPAIDFGSQQVVGYFLGSRPNGCYSMSITRVTQSDDRLVVSYKEQVPAAGAICTMQVVNPAHLVAVPLSPLHVEFRAE
ncbi:protease complex subunit PrcB family protein [Rivibacter subsaxonicus]|nr:protease complex subunit PrcB family protein [Rivibacter subsaxonicus]